MKNKIMTTPPLVSVIWEDACALDPDERWVEHGKNDYTPLLVNTVGFLLHDSEKGVILTSAYSEECIGPRDQIPRGMIRKITRIK